MNQNKRLDQDDVLRLKIIIVIVYAVLTVIVIIWSSGSDSPLASQLVLQLGSVLNGAPSQVQP